MDLYRCPKCLSNGKGVASSTISVSFTAGVDEKGQIVLKKPDSEAVCLHCGAKVGIVEGSANIKVKRMYST